MDRALDLESFDRTVKVRFLAWSVIWYRKGIGGVTVSSARVDLALNRYLEKSGEGKQEGCADEISRNFGKLWGYQ